MIGLLLALGRWSPIRLIGLEPTLGIFSSPARYLLLTHISLALLAAFGFDLVAGRFTSRGPLRSLRPLGIAGLLLTFLFLGSFLFLRAFPNAVQSGGRAAVTALVVGKPGHVLSTEAYAEKLQFLIERLGTWGVNAGNPLLLVSLTALATGSVLLVRRRLSLPLVFALTAAELLVVGWRVHPRVPWSEVTRPSPVVQHLRQLPAGRVLVLHPPSDSGLLFANPVTKNRDEHERLLRDLAVPNVLTRGGLATIDWPAALDLANASDVLGRVRDELGRPRSPELLDRLGVRYVVGSTATPDLTVSGATVLATFPSGDGHAITIWERRTARPRVELLASAPAAIGDPLPPAAGSAEIAEDLLHRVRLTATNTTDRDATLILRDSFYPGWEATVDQRPADIRRADTLFRAVTVPPGTHVMEFSYRATVAGVGLLVSALGWLLTVSILAQTRRA